MSRFIELRRQQSTLALIAITRVASGSLFGTAMAVYIGREGSPLMVSLAFAAFSFGLLVFAPVWGAIADITGRRRLILVSTTFLSALVVVPLTIQASVPLQIVCRGLFAVFTAGFQSTILTIVSEVGGDTGRGKSIGFYNSARSGGAISGRLFVGFLLGLFIPSQMYLLIVVLGLVAGCFTFLLHDPTPTPSTQLTGRRLAREVRQRLVPRGARSEVLKRNGLGWLYVALILRNMTEKGFVAVVPVFLVADVGLSEPLMGAILAISPAVSVVSMYGFGRLSDIVGRKKLIVGGLGGSGVQTLIAVAALLPAAYFARAAVTGSVFFVHAITFSALTTGTIAFIGDIAPADRKSELMGLRSTARGFGGVFGPLIVGVIATWFDYATAYLWISSLSFLAMILVVLTLTESYDAST